MDNLTGKQRGRLYTLITSKLKNGKSVTPEMYCDWEHKIKNDIYIEGTPWNIPKKQLDALHSFTNRILK